MLIVQCLADDIILSYHISLLIIFVCLTVANKKPQMVHGSGFTVNGYFFQQLYRAD